MPTKRRITTTVSATTKPSGSSPSNIDITMHLLSSLPSSPLTTNNNHSSRIGSGTNEGPLALPLLEGLCRRPGAADDIIKDVFHRWKASQLIVRTLESMWKERKRHRENIKKKQEIPSPPKRRRRDKKRKDQQQQEEEEKKHSQQPQLQQQHQKYRKDAFFPSPYRNGGGSFHWLIQSLASPAVRERRVAFQILAMGCPMDNASVHILIEIIVQLIRERNASCESDATCMVGWVTLLKFLLVQVLSDPERLAFCVRPDIGLPWLCRALWKASSERKQKVGTTRVFLSLVDLVHSLVLTGKDDTIYQIHKVLWSERRDIKDGTCSNDDDDDLISPLACLMGTYHLWREHPRKKSMEKYTTMIKQLIDPTLLPKIVSPLEPVVGIDSCSESKYQQRLITFLGRPERHSIIIATTNNKNKSTMGAAATTTTEGSSAAITTNNGNNDSNISSNNPNNVAANQSEKDESGSNNNNADFPLSQSPAGSIPSVLGSPPDRSMVASVARLFSSLYGSSSNATTRGEDGNPPSNEDLVDVYGGSNDLHHQNHDDHDYNEDDQLIGNDHDEIGEAEEDKGVNTINDKDGSNKKCNNTDSNKTVDNKSSNNVDDDNGDGRANNNEEHDEASVSSADDNDVRAEDDEEISSDEGEDCECEEGIIDMDDDSDDDGDDDDDEIMIHEDELPQIEEGLLELQRDYDHRENSSSPGGNTNASSAYPTASGGKGTKERSQSYIKAAMEVLAVQYPPISKSKGVQRGINLTVSAEKALMSSIMHIVKPEKKPLNGKIILRRAPTQEEFFRGNLSKNPISFSMLKSRSSNNQDEPTARDLRQHIANDLQMGDSAELLEILVANKIIDVNLKLRVILQTVWKDHLMQHSGSTSSNSLSSLIAGGGRGGARSFLSSSSGLSLMLYSSLERSIGSTGNSLSITADTPVASLPPMIMTYRLTGVDGEATEDTVSTLNDPEAPSESSSPEEIELLMEKEYGITRIFMTGRAVFCLLRSVEANIVNTLQSIRRDGVGDSENHTRNNFKQSFYPGLSLLVCCAKLSSNRKLLLQARAPTTLLRLLLDVLDALEIKGGSSSESNSTAKGLQELIEVLTSDILLSNGDASTDETEESEIDEDASTLRLLIQAIETSSLSRPLRNVIAKLVPYLTYGKPKLSKELASEFMSHVDSKQLGDYEDEDGGERRSSFKSQSGLMDTFIHASVSLPANEVCNSLRTELIKCGFVERILKHILCNCPTEPPPWSPSLWSKGSEVSNQKKMALENQWKEYLKRPGIKTCFEVLVGLSNAHDSTQSSIGKFHEGNVSFLQFCHWLESTSDNDPEKISIKAIGLLAETLLDDINEFGESNSQEVQTIRRKTRNRKKDIAMDRRKNIIASLVASANPSEVGHSLTISASRETSSSPFWAPVLDLFRTESSTNEAAPPPSKRRKKSPGKSKTTVKPAWMDELESMEDETGLTCAVCQEGRKYKSSELMGLYAFVKKVSIPNGDRSRIDGTNMLQNLPPKYPASMKGSHGATEWFISGKAAGDELKVSTASSSASARRSNYYTTTISAGNAIHISCHARARQADRNHPKAPKSEWEGASLRNSRVQCNVILPLVSSRISSVPLVSVEQALTEHSTAVANLIGVRPKSSLWAVLHDVRLLLFRMAYGESLNADCGGGSLRSNAQLIFYQLSMAKMFESEAAVDAPDTAQHARSLSAGFLAACEIISAEDYDSLGKSTLIRGIADSSAMSALTCILFHNTKDDYGSGAEISDELASPHPKRRWVIGKELFLRGLLNCAGVRHALAIQSSGCVSARNIGTKRSRSRSFTDWEIAKEDGVDNQESSTTSRTARASRKSSSPGINCFRATINDFGNAMRPMIVYYAILDQLSSDFTPNCDDVSIEECASRLVEVIESCQKSKSIHELLEIAKITSTHEEIINELQRGMCHL
mmetsp:Transcript_37080/g.41421  ORF Transcript_37080/g.41421 Transcript_37080/m.41421 type:complete len:1925 (+) Transcript_37080:80-5854(+)